MNSKRFEFKRLTGSTDNEVEEMLNNGWELNSVTILPYGNYYGSALIVREYYFTRDVNKILNYKSDINREL